MILKYLILVSLLCGCNASAFQILPENFDISKLSKETTESLAKVISLTLLKHFHDNVAPALGLNTSTQNAASDFGSMQPFIDVPIPNPGIPENWELPNLHLVSEPDGDSAGIFIGNIHVCKPIVTGLNALQHKAVVTPRLSPLGAKFDYEMKTSVGIKGRHSIGAQVLRRFKVFSFGAFEGSLDKGILDVSLDIGIQKNLFFKVNSININLRLEKLAFRADETKFNDKPLDWNVISGELTDAFQKLWPVAGKLLNGFLSGPISAFLTERFVGKCGIHDLLNLAQGKIDCLGLTGITNEMIENEIENILGTQFEGTKNEDKCGIKYEVPPLEPPPAAKDGKAGKDKNAKEKGEKEQDKSGGNNTNSLSIAILSSILLFYSMKLIS